MALLFVTAAVLHVFNNRRALARCLGVVRRPRVPSREVLLVALGAAGAWLGTSLDTCGVNAIYEFGNRYRAEQRGETRDTEGRQLLAVSAAGARHRLSLRGNKGDAFGYPMFSLWMETVDGTDVETLFISKTLATSRFDFGRKIGEKTWESAVVRRPQALPGWSHGYGHRDEAGVYLPPVDDPLLDAVSGATPTESFNIQTGTQLVPNAPFDVYLEVNQSYDWNEVFSRDAYPDDQEYIDGQTGQPSLVYWTRVDLSSGKTSFLLEPIGHGHPGGKNGEISRSLEGIDSALRIVELPILTVSSTVP